jgi:hypothetical protein
LLSPSLPRKSHGREPCSALLGRAEPELVFSPFAEP